MEASASLLSPHWKQQAVCPALVCHRRDPEYHCSTTQTYASRKKLVEITKIMVYLWQTSVKYPENLLGEHSVRRVISRQQHVLVHDFKLEALEASDDFRRG